MAKICFKSQGLRSFPASPAKGQELSSIFPLHYLFHPPVLQIRKAIFTWNFLSRAGLYLLQTFTTYSPDNHSITEPAMGSNKAAHTSIPGTPRQDSHLHIGEFLRGLSIHQRPVCKQKPEASWTLWLPLLQVKSGTLITLAIMEGLCTWVWREGQLMTWGKGISWILASLLTFHCHPHEISLWAVALACCPPALLMASAKTLSPCVWYIFSLK